MQLKLHAVKRITPAADQVEVRVVAAGLNFSDVLKAMGVYPGLDGAPPVIGGECVGFVTAIGADVTRSRSASASSRSAPAHSART